MLDIVAENRPATSADVAVSDPIQAVCQYRGSAAKVYLGLRALDGDATIPQLRQATGLAPHTIHRGLRLLERLGAIQRGLLRSTWLLSDDGIPDIPATTLQEMSSTECRVYLALARHPRLDLGDEILAASNARLSQETGIRAKDVATGIECLVARQVVWELMPPYTVTRKKGTRLARRIGVYLVNCGDFAAQTT